ncbi:MFS transporter [Lysobacter xinjiangensis]|uniref:MFS transporter n=1 Tax=Cognatilysobacter xinjiangensis TaxID=546892 RepID=A0ABQ3BQC7_9GAMM|nr:MFS transporter [Lysobacter xinjiangensis]GGZ53418.1 MFS transporter [Lysobacter xinjiangensis]
MTADPGHVPSEQARVLRGEWPALLLSMAFFFCVLTAYYVMRPVREQLSAAVGSTQLPWFYAATFVATLLLTPLFAALVARWPRRIMVPVVYGVFVACLLAFVPFFADPTLLPARVLGVVFFVWVSVFNLFVVSVFWIFMSDIWWPAQARRLFPVIAFAGTAGALAGPAITRSLVGVIGIAPLLVVSAVLLGVATVLSVALGRWARDDRRQAARDDAPIGGGMLDGLKQVFAHPFMRSMALLLILADGIGTINYALLADYSGATFATGEARTEFAATVDLATNLLTMLLQAGVTCWLMPMIGAGRALIIWAGIAMAALALVVFAPDAYAPLVGAMPSVAIAAIVSRALAYGLAEPARHALFTQVARNARYKGQNAVDTAVWRFGDLVIALSMNGMKALGAGVSAIAGIGVVAAGIAAAIGWRLSRAGTIREAEPHAE